MSDPSGLRSNPVLRPGAVSPNRLGVIRVERTPTKDGFTPASVPSPQPVPVPIPQVTHASPPHLSPRPVVHRVANGSASHDAAFRQVGVSPRPVNRVINLMNFETMPHIPTVLNSPRSLEVCSMHGIHPLELVHRPLSHFMLHGIPQAIAEIRFEHHEQRRQEKLELLRAERTQRIVAEHGPPPQGTNVSHVDPTASVEVSAVTTGSADDGHKPEQHKPRIASGSVMSDARRHEQEVKRARVQQLLDKQSRRAAVYDRAKRAQLERAANFAEMQRERDLRAAELVKQHKLKVQQDLELRRLKHEDSLESVEHHKRVEELETHRRQESLVVKMSRPVDKLSLVIAKEVYATPRLREEKKRAASAQPRPTV